jgi:sarcosine oxidase subunit gamma
MPLQRDGVTLSGIDIAFAWNVRGDPAQAAFVAEAGRLLGAPLPLLPGASVRGDGNVVLWLGPRSWLFTRFGDAARTDFEIARHALNAAGGALFDLSASYVGWSVEGAAASRTLNRLCPLDLHALAFPAGRCASSLLGHVDALFYRPDEHSAFIVMVARSFAVHALRDLRVAMASGG